jgi:K+-transporting ATPase ATPase C chain
MLLVITVLVGLIYPLVVTGLVRSFFSRQSSGSLIPAGDHAVGSELLAQKFENPKYFWPRPSAADYATIPSGASNKGPTSADLVKAVNEHREKFGKDAPGEMLTASGSGLDPHISVAGAHMQVLRVATARKISPAKISALVDETLEGPQLGFLGEPRVNVLELNLALDQLDLTKQ